MYYYCILLIEGYNQRKPAPFGEVTHLTWVVKDLDGILQYWRKAGLGKCEVEKGIRITNSLTRYRMKPAEAVVNRAVTYIAGVRIDVIEPLEGYNGYSEFLESHGEGVYTVGFHIADKDELARHVDRLFEEKIGVLERGAFETAQGQGQYVRFDTQPVGGIVFELRHDPAFTGTYPDAAEAWKSHRYPFNGKDYPVRDGGSIMSTASRLFMKKSVLLSGISTGITRGSSAGTGAVTKTSVCTWDGAGWEA